jgi:hypothetical protein
MVPASCQVVYASLFSFFQVDELVIAAVLVPTIIPKHDYQDHSSRLFQFFPALSSKLSPVNGLDGIAPRASVATTSPQKTTRSKSVFTRMQLSNRLGQG